VLNSTRINAYIGPEMKHYSVPKDLLCISSPVFVNYFHGESKEAKEGILRAPEDRPEDFESLLDCLTHGTINTGTLPAKEKIAKCLEFVRYADVYHLRDVSEAVIEPLRRAIVEAMNITTPPVLRGVGARSSHTYQAIRDLGLINERTRQPKAEIIPHRYIELVFRICSPGSPLRTFIAQAVLAIVSFDRTGMRLGDYQKPVDEVDGFAAELVYVMSKHPFPMQSQEDWFKVIPPRYSGDNRRHLSFRP
jgi:hypothetical protein